MSQSLYTAMGGISAATSSLNVISNNVANINTTAFKKSSVQFSDVYSTTLSYGSVSTSTSGGTNPKQIGVGTQVSAISTDFSTGSWSSTGQSTDLMINGQGFFSIEATDGTTYYTRAGNFSIDENGNLVTAEGFKVLGTGTTLATHSSDTTVKIPTAITANVSGTDLVTNGATKRVMDLNGTKSTITNGTFQVTVNGGTAVTITVDADGSVDNMVNGINTQLHSAVNPSTNTVTCVANSDGTLTFVDSVSSHQLSFSNTTVNSSNFLTQTGISSAQGTLDTAPLTAANLAAITTGNFTIANSTGETVTVAMTAGAYGTIDDLVSSLNSQLKTTSMSATVDTNGGIKFSSTVTGATMTITPGTSNFLDPGAGVPVGTPVSLNYTSNVLDKSVHITDLTSRSTSANSQTINSDGSLQVTYKDGSTLSVELNDDGTYGFVYTTSDSIKISGAGCNVDGTVAIPANFVIQMATVTNTEGLLSVGNNLYAAGPNTGNIVYTVAGDMGCGKIQSGGLEASNVDLSEELSNMILAQRAVQANSRVFTTTSDIMQTITQMGR